MVNWVRFWVLLSSLLVSSGWVLSLLHQLNRVGYSVVFALASIAFIWWQRRRHWRPGINPARLLQKFKRRFSRPAPFIFLVLVLLACLGGVLYLSNNGDSNAYRTPRVLHWLCLGQWYWIRTLDPRMNIVGCNFEWLCAPLILFTGSVKGIFLINLASYLMLPGLIFSVFTRLKVSFRTAWWWMWLLPSGWCFVFQARSDVNDSYAAVYALAMVDLALRGIERKKPGDLWLSILAAGLVTGVKQSNIPLALLWLIAAWPGARLLLARPIATALAIAAGALSSALPVTALNIKYTGSWQGMPAGMTTSLWHTGSMPWRVIANLFSLPMQNLVPPFFPPAGAWNRAMQRFVQTPLGSHFATFEKFGHLSSGISETEAGIGLGICLLIIVSLVWARRFNAAPLDDAKTPSGISLRLLRLVPWMLVLVFMAETCLFQGARILAPYYPLLFPSLLTVPGNARLVRQRSWQRLALLIMLVPAAMLVVSRNRPLFPAQTILNKLEARYPGTKVIHGIALAYTIPQETIKVESNFRNDFPSGKQIIGYATTVGALGPGLWHPFGTRRVVRVLPDDTTQELRERGIHYVLVDDLALGSDGMTIEQWMKRYNGKLADQFSFQQDRHSPPTHVYIIVLRPAQSSSRAGV